MYIDLYYNPIHKKNVTSRKEAIWVFARHVTCDIQQIANFYEVYERNRSFRLTKKKLSFRGIGLDKNDDTVISAIDRNGETKIIPIKDLTNKETIRLWRELERLADAINCGNLLPCTTMYHEWPNKEYGIIDVIFKLHWSVDHRINYLVNASFTENIYHIEGMSIPFEGKEWIIKNFSREKGDRSVFAYPKNGNKNDLKSIDLLLLPAEELDKIITRIEKGNEKDHQYSLKRPSNKIWE